jgi:MFS family permease
MPQRYVIVAITAVAAFWLYIDRVCFSTLAEPMKMELLLPAAPEPSAEDQLSDDELEAARKKKRKDNPALGENVELTPEDITAAKKKKWADKRMSYALGAFFFTYALFQIPMGTLADRFGARRVLALSIAAWSLVTMATGFVWGFVALLGIRLMLGVTEAGAYPAAAGLIKSWVKPEERGRCSSVVALGGRIGGAVAPWLTAVLAAGLVGVALVEWVVTPTPAAPGPDGKPPPNWRGVFVVYGFCGLAVALLFWLVVRDRPSGAAAPGGQDAARPAGAGGLSGVLLAPVVQFAKHIGTLAYSRNMWLFGSVQFGVNLGWAFIVTLLPTYLKDAYGTPLEQVGPMQSTALTIGLLGMVLGGVFTDWLRARLGPKLGRSVPIGITLSGCAVAFLVIPTLPSAWAVIFALGAMAFCVDLHNPSIWSFAQDVGGKKVGAALGWGNMWGNFGAALSPVLLTEIRLAAGWNVMFVCCGVALASAAVCGLFLDATRPVDEPATPGA